MNRHAFRNAGILPAVFLVVFPVPKLQAQRADVFEFLRLPAGARTSAMGGAGVAEAQGWAGSQINPAGLGRLKRDEVTFSGARWIDDVNYQTAGFAHPFLRGGALSAAVSTLSYGDIPSYSPSGGREGTTDAHDASARLGYGLSWKDRLWWGFQGVYAQENLSGHTAHAVAADGGVLWTPIVTGPLRSATVGGAFRNWGQGPRYGNKTESLPKTFQAGVNFRPFFEGASVSVDGVFSPNKPTTVVLGTEYWARGAVALRLGYNGRETLDGTGLTMGFGFRAWDMDVDYSFVGDGDLGESHHIGLTYRFGRLSEKHYALGLVSLQKKDYASAVVHFAQAISIDPKNRRALGKLREANRLLQTQSKPTAR